MTLSHGGKVHWHIGALGLPPKLLKFSTDLYSAATLALPRCYRSTRLCWDKWHMVNEALTKQFNPYWIYNSFKYIL